MNKKSRGFTLIELLVVISIIGILSTIVLAATISTRYAAKTSAMKSEFVHLKAAFDLYYQNHGDHWGVLQSIPNISTGQECPTDPIFAGTVFDDERIKEQLIAVKTLFLGSQLECLAGSEFGMTATPSCPSGNCATTWSLMFTAPASGGVGTNKWCMTNYDPAGSYKNNIYNTFLGSGETQTNIVGGVLYVTKCIPYTSPNWN